MGGGLAALVGRNRLLLICFFGFDCFDCFDCFDGWIERLELDVYSNSSLNEIFSSKKTHTQSALSSIVSLTLMESKYKSIPLQSPRQTYSRCNKIPPPSIVKRAYLRLG